MQNSEPRIIAGTAKNTKLKVASSSRPVTERVRQSIFDLLTGHLTGKSCIDLYAGAGSLGLEALSRGATSCIFVENNEKAVQALRQNIEATGFSEQTKVLSASATVVLKTPANFDLEPSDIIFIDPPFPKVPDFSVELLGNVANTDSIIVFRKPTEINLKIPDQLEILHQQSYGESEVVFLKA